MLNRILVAIIGIPLLLLMYIKGGIFIFIISIIISVLGLHEYYSMAEKDGYNPYKILGITLSLIILSIKFYCSTYTLDLLVFAFIIMAIFSIVRGDTININKDLGITFVGVAYISLFSYIFNISKLLYGNTWLVIIQISVWLCDSFAYFTGISIGRKIFKDGFTKISPKKSKEGAIGGIVFTILSIYLIVKLHLIDGVNMHFVSIDGTTNFIFLIIFGLIVTISCEIGDLIESVIKRGFNAKDSGNLLLSHGGILDRFDSLIFVMPISYFFLATYQNIWK
ncbi:MAG: phosphatidate cytidylyltransferase [Fusobacteriaceae bacterium]|nr:phosphatidate cytidylyltransferase [Fusobacteriaceae bacterium]